MGSWDFLNEPAGSGIAADPVSGSSYLDRFSTPSYAPPQYAPSRGFWGDVASNLGRGGVETVGLFGHMLDEFGIETRLEEWATEAEDRYQFMRPDLEEATGQEGWFKRSAMGALRSAPATLVPLAAAGAGTMLGGPAGTVAGFGAGIGSLVGLFGAGTYNQTYREHVDELGEEEAHKLALETAAWEVGTEGLSDAAAVLTGGLLGAPVKGIMGGLKAGVKPTLQSVMQAGPVNFLRAALVNTGAEVGSESLNAFMQTKAQIKAGLDPNLTPTQAALASIGPSLFLSGGITLGTQGMGAANRNRIVNTLKSERTTQGQKYRAAQIVESQLRSQKPEWADNWKQVSDHIINNGGTFDISNDFVNQANAMLTDKDAVATEEQTRPVVEANKELDDLFNNPEGIIEEALVSERLARGLNVSGRATVEEQLEALESDLRQTGFYDTEEMLMLPEFTADTEAPDVIQNPFQNRIAGLLPAPAQPSRVEQQAGAFGTGLVTERQQAAAAAQAEREQFEADRLQSITSYSDAIMESKGPQARRLSKNITEYSRGLLASKQAGVEKAQAAKQARETREKMEILGVPNDVQLAPEIYAAVEATPMEEIQAEGFSAVEPNLPQQEPAAEETVLRTETPQPQRTLTPNDRARLVQAAGEFSQIQDRQEQGETMSPEDQTILRELETEVNNLIGKTDENVEAIVPGIGDLMGARVALPEAPAGDVENALRTQISRIEAEVSAGNKTDREGRTEAQLLQGLFDNDNAAIEAALSQYTDEGQLATLTNTALQMRDALDQQQDTPGNRQLKNRIYQVISAYATEPTGRKLPEGFVTWEKVPTKGSGELYTAVDEGTGKIYLLERMAVEAGERGGRWRVYSTQENAQGDVTEDTILIGAKDQPLQSVVRQFYRTSGEGPATQDTMPKHQVGTKIADKTGPYTASVPTKTFWRSKDGELVAVPRGSRKVDGKSVQQWGVMREADRAQWYDLPPDQRTDAWYELDGNKSFSQEDALKLLSQETGAPLAVEENLLEAESAFLAEFREQERETGLEKGSKSTVAPGTARRKPGKTRGADAKLAEQLAAESPPGKVKKVKPGPVLTENILYDVAKGREKNVAELKQKLEEISVRYVQAFEGRPYRKDAVKKQPLGKANTGRMRVIRESVFSALGYRSSKKAPKEVQTQVDQFLNGVLSSNYQSNQGRIDTLQGQIDRVDNYKKAKQSQRKTAAEQNKKGFDSDIRQANRELKALRDQQADVQLEQQQYAERAADLIGISPAQAANRLAVSSQVTLTPAVTVPAPPRRRLKKAPPKPKQPTFERPEITPKEEIAEEQIEPKNQPQNIAAFASPSETVERVTPGKTKAPVEKGLFYKGYDLYSVGGKYILRTPEGAVSHKFSSREAARKFIDNKTKVQKTFGTVSKLPLNEKNPKPDNGWTNPEDGTLVSDNGKFTAVLRENEIDNPFLTRYQWVVTDKKGNEVAYFGSAREVIYGINGATKTGYLPQKAKGTAKLFSIGEATDTKATGNTAQSIASKLTRFLGKEGTKKWNGRLTVVQSLDEASGVGTEIKARGVDGPVLGYYNPSTNSVTLVADNIKQGEEQDVFLHEGLHFVMENDGDFVRNKEGILKRITTLKNRAGAVQNAWNEAAEKNPNASEQHIAEEAYAYLLQNPENRNVGVVRQALAAIKRFLIKMRIPVGALGLTDGDLVSMATKSITNMRNVKEMDDANRSFTATQYAPDEVRRKKLDDQKFRNFFRNSLVKERGGAEAPPIILYNPSSNPNVNPEQGSVTLGQAQDPSLLPYLGINLSAEDTAMNTADQGSVYGYYVRAENPRRMTAKQLNAGISTPEDAAARKKVLELDGHDSIFVMSGPGPNATVERVIVFNNDQIQPSERAWRQVNQSAIKFSTADAPNAEVEVPETTPDRSQTSEQLSAKSTLQDDGGRWTVFAPTTEQTPKNADGKKRSDKVFKNTLTGTFHHHTNFDTETQDYTNKRDITQAEYNLLAEEYSSDQQQKDGDYYDKNVSTVTTAEKAAEKGKDWLKKTKQTAKDLVESISDAVKFISPPAYGKLNRMEFNIQDTVRRYGVESRQFMEQYSQIPEKDKWLLDQALRNSDFRTRNRIITEHGMEEGWNKVQAVLDEIKQGMVETGLLSEGGLLKNYFPRSIRTGKVDDLVASLRDSDSEFETVLGDEMDQLGKRLDAEGKKLTDADRHAHIQKMINTGHYQFIPKPGASKDRGITYVKPEQAEFYDDTMKALEGHIYDTVQAIEYRRLLGRRNLTRPVAMNKLQTRVKEIDALQAIENRSEKQNEKLKELHRLYEVEAAELDSIESDLAASIAGYVDEELGKGNERATELIHLLRSRMTQRGTHGFWGGVRDVGYMATLGSPMSAITQIGDLALSTFANNPINTTAAVFNNAVSYFSGDKRMTKDYFDFSHSLGDFSKSGIENKGTQYALDKVLTFSGLKGMDLFGKEVFLNAAMRKNQKMSTEKFVEQKAHLFGGDKKRAAKAHRNLQKGQLETDSRDELFVLFNDLSQWQPISLSEMPKMYNTAGNGRIFYMLKSFNIKALNAIRNNVQTQWQAGNKATAAVQAAWAVTLISLAGAGADEIKDWVLGKETDFGDHVWDNIIGMTMMNRFTLEKGFRQGQPLTAIVNGQLPPMRYADYLIDDIAKFGWDRDNFKFKTINNVPVVGRIAYSRMEGGQTTELANRKRSLYDEIKENARKGLPLYSGTVRFKLQSYNEMAKGLEEERLGYKQLKNVRSKERKKMREENKTQRVRAREATKYVVGEEKQAILRALELNPGINPGS